MAKRKRSSDNGGCGGCLAIIIIPVLIVFITPVALLSIFIYSLFKYFSITRYYHPFKKTYDDFWLNKEDKDEYKYYNDVWIKNYKLLEDIDSAVEEQGISRNNDGAISTRSKAGKKLKADFDKAKLKEENASNRIYDLQYIPQTRWEECNKYLKNSWASFIGIIGYGIGYTYLQLTHQAGISWREMGFDIDTINIIITSMLRINWFNIALIDKVELFILSICIAIISWVLTLICSKPLAMLTPYPPEVDIENIDLYEGKH
ncbi:hypothetical protein B0186_00165 [Canicola haemoglobinophilus]|uniref:Uncharacterized protein n=1 Tax=Canicola haemoglobinophilus TaxID=733 RepID=A0A1V4B450_9PAST|nr:hypothetical protein [Canicola haemoglobinophilus]OOS02397.1 hypothetical protein B0186_00165 [Canicola haemoglobinophilus]STO59325.1 Uncharacterised protein [Canicola haemoglobinophilus]